MNLTLASTLLFASLAAPAQPPPTPAPPPDSKSSTPIERPVSWKRIIPNVIGDQARIWSFPARLIQGQNLLPTAAVLGTTAALVAADPSEAAYFRRTSTFHAFNSVFTANATLTGTIAVPVSLYAVGLFRKDPKMQRTALYAGEAVADAEIVTTVLKDASRRLRPAAIPAQGNFSNSWFKGSGSLRNYLRGNGSFPSGHAIAAFSVATVVSRRYRNHRWVPYAGYGLAALVGFSRISLTAHFLSDVFMGGALGYSISRFTVLRD